MAMNKVIVIGGKGAAIVIAEQIYDAQLRGQEIEFLGFAFDDTSFGDSINGFPILGKSTEIYELYKNDPDVGFIYQLYRPDLMKERIQLLHSYNIPRERFFTFIHPLALIARSAKIGQGVVVLANSVVNPNVVLGDFCTVQSNVLIGHDSKVGEYNFFAAHSVIGSNINFGEANFIGLNASFNNYIVIGDNTFIGMGSNVTKNIPSETKVYGNPAKPFHSKIKPL